MADTIDATISKAMDQAYSQTSNLALQSVNRLATQINDGAQFGFETMRTLALQTILGGSVAKSILDDRQVRDQPNVSPEFAFRPGAPYTAEPVPVAK